MEDKGGILYLVCGPSGSGKTSFLENVINPNEIIIHRDEIRFEILKPGEPFFSHEKEVYNRYLNEVAMSIRYGYNTYADATNLDEKSRYTFLYMLKYKKCFPSEINAIYFNVSLKTCLERNEMRRWTKGYVPTEEVEKIYHAFVPPTYSEGFTHIWEVDENWNVVEIGENE